MGLTIASTYACEDGTHCFLQCMLACVHGVTCPDCACMMSYAFRERVCIMPCSLMYICTCDLYICIFKNNMKYEYSDSEQIDCSRDIIGTHVHVHEGWQHTTVVDIVRQWMHVLAAAITVQCIVDCTNAESVFTQDVA